ncbi:MAG: MFS transporter [Fibrobacteres bacterium]|nr:MFS transporter [Fibrobacterota bacterium]
MSKPEERHQDKLIELSKKLSIREAAAFSFMDGFGLRNIMPFALAIGANNLQIGLLNSLPGLIANMSQLLTIKAMRIWSRKKITVVGVTIQAFLWFALIGVGALYYIGNIKSHWPATLMIGFYTFLIMSGTFAGPAWSSWMKDLVTKDLGAYFGKRNRIAGSVALVNSLIAGWLLDFFKGIDIIFAGFTLLFIISFAGRFIGSRMLKKQHEPQFIIDETAYFTFAQFVKKMANNNFGRFVIFVSIYSLVSQISSPFISVYMLKNLDFSYTQYTLVILAGSLTSLLSLPRWGRFADKYGALKAIKLSTLTVPIVPFLWMVPALTGMVKNDAFIYLLAVQGLAGFLWTGYELSVGNFIFNAVTRQRLAICMSYFSLINGVGALIGALLGSWLASLDHPIFGIGPIMFVFAVSGAGRLLAAVFAGAKVKEVRPVEQFGIGEATHFLKTTSESTLKYFESFTQKIMRRTPF